jgi:hypothetical protein
MLRDVQTANEAVGVTLTVELIKLNPRPFWLQKDEAQDMLKIVGVAGPEKGGLRYAQYDFNKAAAWLQELANYGKLDAQDPVATLDAIRLRSYVEMYLQAVYKLYHLRDDGRPASMDQGQLASKARLILGDPEWREELSRYAFEIKLEGLAALSVNGQMTENNPYKGLLPSLSGMFLEELNTQPRTTYLPRLVNGPVNSNVG